MGVCLDYLNKHSAGKGKILREYEGEGKLSTFQQSNFLIGVKFILKQFECGEILLFCPEVPIRIPFFNDKWLNQSFSLIGFSDDGYEITCPELSLREGNTSLEEERSDLLFIATDMGYITLEKNFNNEIFFQKCIGGVCNYSYSGVMHQMSIDNAFSVKLIKSEFVDISAFTPYHAPIFSGEWEFEGKIVDIGKIEDYIAGLNVLSSLLTCEEIDSYYLDCYQNGEIVKTILYSNRKSQYHGNLNVVRVANPFGRELSEMIDEIFPHYFHLNETLDLSNLIYFKRKSEQAESLEIKFILGTIAIEAICSKFVDFLKYHHNFSLPRANIKDNANIIKKQLRKYKISADDVFVKELSEKLHGFPSLRDKIQILCDYYGISYSDQDLKLVSLRNDLIHYGKVRPGINLQTERNRLSDFISRICLTLLDYNGQYFSWMEYSYIELVRKIPKDISEFRTDNIDELNLRIIQYWISKIRERIRMNKWFI